MSIFDAFSDIANAVSDTFPSSLKAMPTSSSFRLGDMVVRDGRAGDDRMSVSLVTVFVNLDR